MEQVNRRSALKIGFAAASAAVVSPVAAQTTDALSGKDTSPWPGVVVRTYGESPSLIPGFKTVSMRDIIMQPGSKTAAPPMANPMVCHILEGEMRIDQEGRSLPRRRISAGPATRTQRSRRSMTGASLLSCGSRI